MSGASELPPLRAAAPLVVGAKGWSVACAWVISNLVYHAYILKN